MPHYNFDEDLPIAKKTEQEVAGLLEKKYNAIILEANNASRDYDIKATIKGFDYTFEVKEDFICEKTGNVGVEFECRGKISGIQVSKANFYIYKLHTRDYGIQFFMQKTSTLKRKIANKDYFRIVNGGDVGSNSMNYLFKYNVFVKDGVFLTLDK